VLTLIDKFLYCIPYNLRRDIKIEYGYKERELRFLLERSPEKYTWLTDEEIVKFLIFLSIISRRVISPIRGATDFTEKVTHKGANGLKMGSVTINREEVWKLKRMIDEYSYIMRSFGLDDRLFDYSNMTDFLNRLKEIKEKGKNGSYQ